MGILSISCDSSAFARRLTKHPMTSCRDFTGSLGERVNRLVSGASLSRLNGAEPVEFAIEASSDYLLVARLSGRTEVRYDIGKGPRKCDFRFGHMLIYSASPRSYWRLERPDQTVYLSIPAQLLQRAWERDKAETWPGMVEMFSFKQDSQIIQTLEILVNELDRSEQINSAYAESVLFQLATHLVRRYSKASDSVVRNSGLPPSRLNKVLEYVSGGLEEHLGLSAMARVAGISPYYFCREFKKTMGITPYGYIVQQRIDRAKALLRNSSSTITDIAEQLLFATPSHFTSTFRKQVGCTPSEFRLRS
jgi:AraC family transcriptional regulator